MNSELPHGHACRVQLSIPSVLAMTQATSVERMMAAAPEAAHHATVVSEGGGRHPAKEKHDAMHDVV